jgi:hypothetical protein
VDADSDDRHPEPFEGMPRDRWKTRGEDYEGEEDSREDDLAMRPLLSEDASRGSVEGAFVML